MHNELPLEFTSAAASYCWRSIPLGTRERRRCAPSRHARAMETSHTIVLIQYNLQSSSRTYLDYEGLHRALDGAHLLPAAAARGLNLKR